MMRRTRSEGQKRVLAGVASIAVLVAAGCRQLDGLVELEDVMEGRQFRYELAELSESGLAKRMREIDAQYAEPRTPAKVNLSLETSLLSISHQNGYAALPRGARACAWLARYAATPAESERYALQGIAWGKEAKKRCPTKAEAYYYLALNRGVLLELRDYRLKQMARDMRADLRMAEELDAGLDHCGPKRALGELIVKTKDRPLYLIGSYSEGIALLEQAVRACPSFGGNHLALAEAFVAGGEFERARTLLNQLAELPDPPDHAADHQAWLVRASELLSDLPGL